MYPKMAKTDKRTKLKHNITLKKKQTNKNKKRETKNKTKNKTKGRKAKRKKAKSWIEFITSQQLKNTLKAFHR